MRGFSNFERIRYDYYRDSTVALEAFKAVRVFNCPMVNRAVPGAARNGQWIQLEPPLRNPYFGAEMLECGTEVK